MKLYPWLFTPYKNIIQQHKIKKAHHATLIKTSRGIGVFQLIWFVSRWLLCLKTIGVNFCNQCHGCKLMLFKNHPDWHHYADKNVNILNVNDIREINNKVLTCSQQGGSKIIILSDIKKLTESAINAFLKTLEEPPKDTWFFLVNYNNSTLSATLNSRCLIYKLFPPTEKDSLNWLKSKNIRKNISYLTALRINQGSPISAKKFINSELWTDRIYFYQDLFHALRNKNLLKILPLFCNKNSTIKINWICLLLFDAVKLNFKEYDSLINSDQLALIQFFSCNYSNVILDHSIRTWMRCRYRLLNISGINYELLLLEQLLLWEKLLNFSFTS